MRGMWLRTGVSYAKHATMFGQRGAFSSGRVWTNSTKASAASKPPILDARRSGKSGYD